MLDKGRMYSIPLVSGPPCFGSSSAGNDVGSERADARVGNKWVKEEVPGRRFFVCTRFLLALSPATGRV